MLLSYSTGSYVDYNFCTKTETDTLAADRVIYIGDIALLGMLDTGTSGYTNSRIRCNATVGGYTGYAELKAANSYDMFLNLSTTRTDGGWMYFKVNNDDYIQLSGSDNKVNIYKDTSISPNLTINGDLHSSMKFPLDIKNSTIHIEFLTLASFHHGIANSGSWLQFSRDGTSDTWQAGMSSDNSYVTRASDATNRSTVNQNGDTTISGTLNAQRLSITNTISRPIEINNTMHNGPYLVEVSQNYSNNDLLFALRCLPFNTLWCFGVATSNQYIISPENSTNFSIQSNGNTPTSGNLDVGPSQAQSNVNTYFNHVGSTGFMMMGDIETKVSYTLKLINNMVKCFYLLEILIL